MTICSSPEGIISHFATELLWSPFVSCSTSEQERDLFDPANDSKPFTCLRCNRWSSKKSTLSGSTSLEQLGTSSAITQRTLQGEPLSSLCSLLNSVNFPVR